MYQQHLAEACGVDRSSISALEIGRVMPSPPLLRKLAEALGCSVDDLLDAVDQDQAVPA
jgi:transcriptional regulator with XRE-family HTH domain